MKTVSVILTSYNHAKFIGEAIDSVLNQSFQDFELIIWDDGSSDGSWDIIQSYSDSRIKAYQNKKNKGPVYGVNKAISEISQGKYIAVHHSDDVWESSKLEKQLDFIEANQSVGAVFSRASIINERGEPLAENAHLYCRIFNQPNRSRYEWLRYFFFNGNALCHPSVLIRKQCYLDCGLYLDSFTQLPDFDMWVRLSARYNIHVMSEPLIKFRLLDGELNTSGNRIDSRIRGTYENYKVLQRYRELLCNKEIFNVFPEFNTYDKGKNTDYEYVLSIVCLESSQYFLKHLFAFEILFDILNNPIQRQIVEQHYNFSYKDFITLTGTHDLFSIELISNLQIAVSDRDSQMDKFLQEIDLKINSYVADTSAKIETLNETISAKDKHIISLNYLIATLEAKVGNKDT